MEDIKKNISIEFYEFQKNNKKNIYLLISIIILIIFIVLTKIINNYFESYIKANVIKSKCGADISEAETFRHIFLQHNKSDEELKFTFIIIVISLLIILFNERNNIIHFNTLFTDDIDINKDINTNFSICKYLLIIFNKKDFKVIIFLLLLIIILLVVLVIINSLLKNYIIKKKESTSYDLDEITEILNDSVKTKEVIDKYNDNKYNDNKDDNKCLNFSKDDNDKIKLYSYINSLLRENKIKYDYTTKKIKSTDNIEINETNAKEKLKIDASDSDTTDQVIVSNEELKNLFLILLRYIIIYIIILTVLLFVYSKFPDNYPKRYFIIFLIFSGTIFLFTLIIRDIQSYIYQKNKKTTEITCET
tara:strand:- start:425 stop:1510 length:1086 start_codon:yes stop_codon:yes gene_type:complete